MKNHVNRKTGRPFPRGARPSSRATLAAALPFRPAFAAPAYFGIFPLKMSNWLNDQYGDCVTAEECFNKACNGVFIEDNTVMTWCQANNTLNGADLQPVIQLMQASGFVQDGNVYGDGSPLSVDYTDAPTLQAAIYTAGMQGGAVKIGIAADQLPPNAGNQNGWFLVSDAPDQNEDHCVSLNFFGTAQNFIDAMKAAYGITLALPAGLDPTTPGYGLYTWSTIGFVTVPALINMCGEAWLRNPSSVNRGTGTPDPDQVFVTNAPTPTPPTPPVPPTPTPPVPPTPTPPVPPTPNAATLTLSAPVPAGTFDLIPTSDEWRAMQQRLGLTPAQWLQLIMAIMALVLQFLNPPAPPSSPDARGGKR